MKKKTNPSTILFILVFLAGLSLLLYPTVSDWWNSTRSTKAIASYSETVANLDQAEYDDLLQAAQDYNHGLAVSGQQVALSDQARQTYQSLLDVSGTGIMGHIEIPAIDVDLPIRHGTTDSVLQIGVGHLDWTSLPVGGETSHCVLSAHRGLPSARLFTDLDQLAVGDVFFLYVLDETLTYQVEEILTVEPGDTKELFIRSGQDLCTLVTCTPYGINTHRLLVQGQRIENLPADYIHVSAEAVPVDPLLVAPLVAAPILIGLFVLVMVKNRKK